MTATRRTVLSMAMTIAIVLLVAAAIPISSAFLPSLHNRGHPVASRVRSASSSSSMTETSTSASSASTATNAKDPLLIRAARGESTERTPVWMMRQAGRHIAEYRELCKTYPTFRQRSEIAEVAVEVSLQPWRNYKTDGCILFSDILTPLPGMGADFVIDEKVGPVMTKPIRTHEDVQQVRRTVERTK